MDTKIAYLKKLPTLKKLSEIIGYAPTQTLVIYDRKLEKTSTISKWLKTGQKVDYPVTAGEKLKDLDYYPGHAKKILRKLGPAERGKCVVIAVGGGTVGDFAGFFASTFKRGVPFVHIPSTMLAAMDSAHGGKNALNISGVKNQVGTFYPAEAVLIAREILQTIPVPQMKSAGGELAKTILIEGGEFFEQAKEADFNDFATFWKFLPQAIDTKNRIVEQDPLEKSGKRQILNLGHTFGHALESYYGISHGLAVGLGLVFSTHWSHHHGFLSLQDQEVILDFLHDKVGVPKIHQFVKGKKSLTRAKLEKLILDDKKVIGLNSVTFIFLEGIGKPFRKTVDIDSFLTEAQRQGWSPQ